MEDMGRLASSSDLWMIIVSSRNEDPSLRKKRIFSDDKIAQGNCRSKERAGAPNI